MAKVIVNSRRSEGEYFFVDPEQLDAPFESIPYAGYFNFFGVLFEEDKFPRYYTLMCEELKRRVVDVLDTINQMERLIIELRYLTPDGNIRTLESVGQELGYTRERIRQIEKKAFRKLRHPCRRKQLRMDIGDIFSDIIQKSCSADYSKAFESILIGEVEDYKKGFDTSGFVFKNIIGSPRFVYDDEREMSLKMSVEIHYLLTDDKLILDLDKTPWARYDLDVSTMFDQKGEVALTRCGLQGEILLKILRQGYFYVSDITDHSEILIEYGFAEQSEEADTLKPFLKADSKIFEHRDEIVRKLLKVRIPNRLKLRMDELGISNFNDLLSNKDKFNIGLRQDIESLVEFISLNNDEKKKESENIDKDNVVEKSD